MFWSLHDKNNINDDLASSFINDNNLDLEYKYQNFLVTIGNGKPEIKSYEYEKKVVEINLSNEEKEQFNLSIKAVKDLYQKRKKGKYNKYKKLIIK